MQDPYAIPKLIKVLENEEQEPMVRHEAGIYFLSDARMKVTVLLLLYISRNPKIKIRVLTKIQDIWTE
jgi:hypothetical protein